MCYEIARLFEPGLDNWITIEVACVKRGSIGKGALRQRGKETLRCLQFTPDGLRGS